ncbi:MAG: hypothetical protein M3347_08690, partial [Armatimonadota bacterium]|nr:hypothetical protein [Armatimonadota bacterium]
MASEKSILRVLDVMTVAPQAEIESLGVGAPSRVREIRRVVDSNNVVGLGISEKITKGEPTGQLALTFYVERKVPLKDLSADVAVPPTVPEAISGSQA